MEEGIQNSEPANEKQLELGKEDNEVRAPKILSSKQGDLKVRDAEIIEYCAQMKFASHPVLYDRFFRVTLKGQPSKSDWYAKEKIYSLANLGYLKSNVSVLCSDRYYSATPKGHQLAQAVMPFRDLTKPIQGFDIRTFLHDRELGIIRQELENEKEITMWISDRRLRMGKAQDFMLTSEFIPDAVVQRPNGDFEAVELEIATKARSRYVEKVQFYLNLIRDSGFHPRGIRRVHYLCMREGVFKILKDECSAYGNYFSVSMRNDLDKQEASI